MIVGGIEEIRLDEAANEVYVADNYLGGRVMVFDLNTFAFKRGWGAYGHKLSDISINDADHEFVGESPAEGVPRPPDAEHCPTTGWCTPPIEPRTASTSRRRTASS